MELSCFEQANRELIAKALSELYYEEVLFATTSNEKNYSLTLQGGVSYSFMATPTIWTSLVVDPDSITRTPANEYLNAADFFIDAQTELEMSDITLANFLEELNNTISREVILIKKRKETSAYDALLMAEEDRQSLLSGHPKILLNKGRVGWSEEDADLYSPESEQSFRLHWVALKKDSATKAHFENISMYDLLQESMDETELKRFMDNARMLGADEESYFYLPVHPWQYKRFIKTQFALDFVHKKLMDIGVYGDLYRAQISLRTLSNVSRPGKLDIKLPLTILNTSAIRGLPAKYIKAGPQLSELVEQISHTDELLSKLNFGVLKERAGISYVSAQFGRIQKAPYRYHEYLGATWRENMKTVAAKLNAQAMMTGGLFYVDSHSHSLMGAMIEKSKLETREWLNRYFTHVVVPLYHLQLKYGLGLVSHGQNIVLVLKNFAPAGVLIKDFGGDLRLCEDFKESYASYEFANVLTTLPGHYLIHDLYTGHFITVLRYLSSILKTCHDFSEEDFYQILSEVINEYHQKNPELVSEKTNILAPVIQRVLINKVRFKIGYGDSDQRPVPLLGSELRNPLHTKEDKLSCPT